MLKKSYGSVALGFKRATNQSLPVRGGRRLRWRRCDPLLETGVGVGDGGGWLLAMAIAAPPAPLADAAVDSGVEEDEEGEGDDAQHDEAAPVVVARVDVVHAHGRDGDERAGLTKQKERGLAQSLALIEILGRLRQSDYSLGRSGSAWGRPTYDDK